MLKSLCNSIFFKFFCASLVILHTVLFCNFAIAQNFVGKIDNVKGDVIIERDGQKVRAITKGNLVNGDTILLPSGSFIEIFYHDGEIPKLAVFAGPDEIQIWGREGSEIINTIWNANKSGAERNTSEDLNAIFHPSYSAFMRHSFSLIWPRTEERNLKTFALKPNNSSHIYWALRNNEVKIENHSGTFDLVHWKATFSDGATQYGSFRVLNSDEANDCRRQIAQYHNEDDSHVSALNQTEVLLQCELYVDAIKFVAQHHTANAGLLTREEERVLTLLKKGLLMRISRWPTNWN